MALSRRSHNLTETEILERLFEGNSGSEIDSSSSEDDDDEDLSNNVSRHSEDSASDNNDNNDRASLVEESDIEIDNDIAASNVENENDFLQINNNVCHQAITRGGRQGRVRTRGGIVERRGRVRTRGGAVERRGRVRTRGGTVERRGRVRTRGGTVERRGRAIGQRGTDRTPVTMETLKEREIALGWANNDVLPNAPPIIFTGTPGITCPLDENSTEFDCFSQFFCDAIFDVIKTETNRYAHDTIAAMKRKNTIKPRSLWNNWKPITRGETKFFFAIIVHMSLVKKPSIDSYWSLSAILNTPFPSKLMSRDRFRMILSMFHLNDNRTYIPKGQPGHDPLHKLRPFYNHLSTQFAACLYPNCELTIDEGICPFRGRIGFRVYIKNKPDKYGLKFYILCDAATGYVLSLEMYCGKGINDNSVTAIFDRILSKYYEKGHCVYMDRFYSSPLVFTNLYLKNTLAVGTCQVNRKEMPKHMCKTKLEKGQFIFRRRNELLAIKWLDTRDVYVLSSKHMATTSTVMVKTREGMKEKIKPDLILDYNKNKTGVDRSDQMISYYPFRRKSMKWWKKCFFHLFTMSMINSFVLFKKTRPAGSKNITIEKFFEAIGNELTERAGVELVTEHFPCNADRLSSRHFISKLPATEKKQHPTKSCHVCKTKFTIMGKRLRRETPYYCRSFNKALCLDTCFELYHTRANYSN